MAKKSLLTVDGIRRQVKKQFLTIDGTYRKIKKAFITRDGVYRPFYAAEPPSFGGYTGDYTVSTVMVDGAECDLYTLTSSGTLTLNDSAEYWMCGGGGAGGSSGLGTGRGGSGGGGGGGYTKAGSLLSGIHTITIGAASGVTQIITSNSETIQASCGVKQDAYSNGGAGGSGGGAGYRLDLTDGVLSSHKRLNNGVGARESTYPFGLEELGAHCAGGNSGQLYYDVGSDFLYEYGLKGGSCGSYGTQTTWNEVADVAERGGGRGGVCVYTSTMTKVRAKAATFYGSGGGGQYLGVKDTDVYYHYEGGAGYQGVCYILIPR